MVILQKINKNQMVKLLDAINREGVDNQFWAVSSYESKWNAGEVFGSTNQTESEPGDYITVMYDENPDGQPVSYYFYTKTKIMAFIQRENEVMNLAAEMREITQQKPILCLESHTRLFRSALDSIMEAYSEDEYSDEDLLKEYCPDVIKVYTDWMRYKFRCSNEYEAYMLMVGDVEGNNVCNAINRAWTWFHTGFVNNFISKDPETNLLHLNW